MPMIFKWKLTVLQDQTHETRRHINLPKSQNDYLLVLQEKFEARKADARLRDYNFLFKVKIL
jgi:hypothetical protein